ncbi:TolB family protein [Paenibacillus arenilitoris]|uniref:Uncharacterized protein n=1 Tax=Paenibacillus arenilitoris TaxID=2772299 RepID=A0A927CP48_9BACL|nr:hypothetical protein [Paenibacillus arenilitoris]MBD2871648.1 hypothetical protein [Paenibacillus arenilitoris]
MSEGYMEESLHRLKSRLPVDEQLKKRLRASIPGWRRRRIIRRSAWISAVTAMVLMLVFTLQYPGAKTTVEAAALQIRNQVSFVDIGSGTPLGVSEFEGTVYIPVEEGGVHAYDGSGYREVTEREADDVKVDPSGTKLLLSNKGTIGVHDLSSGSYTELLRGDGTALFYEQPTWKDERTILYVKKVIEPRPTHGFDVLESTIYAMDIVSGKAEAIGEGAYPSYAAGSKSIVFQRERDSVYQVIRMELASGDETVIDEGRFPSVSQDGGYVAYVKTETGRRELKPNAYVQEDVDQMWISDVDGRTKRKVTENLPIQTTIDEREWADQLKEGDPEQTLQQSGLYSYYQSSWGTNAESLYVLKGGNAEGAQLRVMRIDFAEEALGAAETVEAFNQARIRRDLDFARSLLRNDPEFVIVSNPRQVSYSVIGSGEEAGRAYVDVEEYWSYTANPAYSIEKVRYYVSASPNGFLIDEMEKRGELTVSERPDGSIELQEEDGSKRTLLTRGDLPKELVPQGDYRFASLAYIPGQNKLIFTIQALQDEEAGQKASVIVASYDAAQKTFEQLGRIDTLRGMNNVGVSNMIVSASGGYAALDLFSDDDPAFGSHTVLIDLKQKEQLSIEEQTGETEATTGFAYYWEGDSLHFMLASGEETIHYKWDAVNKQLHRP